MLTRDIYDERHERFRESVRDFFETRVVPDYPEWEKTGYLRLLQEVPICRGASGPRRASAGCSGSALGMSDPAVGSDMKAMATSAKRDGETFVVNGAKTFISNGIRPTR